MTRHFSYTNEISQGAKRLNDAIALGEDGTRAHRAEDMF
jgi:hypothetical protein